MKTVKWTNAQVEAAVRRMEIEPRNGIFGIPRGGVPVAYMVANVKDCWVVDDPADADYIVDDIVCTGRTRDKWLLEGRGDVEFVPMIPKQYESVWIVFPWEGSVTGSQEDIVIRQLEAIGEDPKRDGLRDTPDRVIRSWGELFQGYSADPLEMLGKTFDNEYQYDQMVILRNIEFYSTCEHHLLPFFGKVHIGYIPSPKGKIVGISKLSRLVSCFARRLQVQERLTQQVAETLEKALEPLGIAVYVEAQHLCMMARGVRQSESVMVTSAIRGVLKTQERARLEFLLLRK